MFKQILRLRVHFFIGGIYNACKFLVSVTLEIFFIFYYLLLKNRMAFYD